MSFLNSSIYCVDQTLSALGNVAPGKSKGAEKDTRSSSQQNGSILRTTSSFSGVGAPVQNVQDAMSADGLRPGVQSLEKMARAIQPIVTGFDLILVRILTENRPCFHSGRHRCRKPPCTCVNYFNIRLLTRPNHISTITVLRLIPYLLLVSEMVK